MSITMTFISTIAALGDQKREAVKHAHSDNYFFLTGMMPLWLFLLGPYLSDGAELAIPFGQLIIGLLA